MVPVGVEMVLRIRFVIRAAELARFLLGAFDRFYDYVRVPICPILCGILRTFSQLVRRGEGILLGRGTSGTGNGVKYENFEFGHLWDQCDHGGSYRDCGDQFQPF